MVLRVRGVSTGLHKYVIGTPISEPTLYLETGYYTSIPVTIPRDQSSRIRVHGFRQYIT
jgi:hypothetical protein